jgi:PAS domain-containing protein
LLNVIARNAGLPTVRNIASLNMEDSVPTTTKEFVDLLTQMFVQAPTFMAILRGPEHRFELANPSYLKLVGNRQIIGRTVSEALPEAVDQGFLLDLDRAYQSGTSYTAFGARFILHGSPLEPAIERLLDFVFQPLRDADGNVTGIFVQGSDVTDRAVAERQLRSSEELYKGLFDAIDEGFCIIEFVADRTVPTAITFTFAQMRRMRDTLASST